MDANHYVNQTDIFVQNLGQHNKDDVIVQKKNRDNEALQQPS